MSSTDATRASRASTSSHDRKLRYRVLLEDLSTLEEETNSNENRIEKISKAVKEAKGLLAEGGLEEKVKHPGEGYLDSRVLRATSEMAIRCSEAVSGNVNTYDRHELAQHIRENPSFWEFSFPREVPVSSCLFGTFEATPAPARERAARRRVEKQQAAALKAPDNVDKLDKVEEGSEMVSRVNRFVTKMYRTTGKPISYFHLVVDPTSFSRTVENVYYISFLVRDAMLSVELDARCGLPHVTPRAPPGGPQADGRGIADENQFIVSLDMARWRELIEAFHITRPMMVLKRL